MKKLFPNVDFEYELLRGVRPITHRVVRRQVERWATIMRLVEGWEDAHPSDDAADADWLPWGVTESFPGWRPGAFPDPALVRRVNGKDFSQALEYDLGVALPGASTVETVDAARAACADGEWLIKNPWGVAGRERLEVRDGDLDVRWVERQLRLSGCLVVEPRIEDIVDWSVQFEIADGRVDLLGSSELVTDTLGNHRGHRVGRREAPDVIVNPAIRAVKAVAEAGYFGPLGVDAFEGTHRGERIVRPICEINARMTFGRLALELARYVPETSFYWWHPSVERQKTLPTLAGDIREATGPGHYALPAFVDEDGRTGTRVVLGDLES